MFKNMSTTQLNEEAVSSGEPVVSDVKESPVPEVKAPVVKSFKVNGKEVQVSEDQFDKYIQLGMASTEKFQEAKRIQEEAQKIIGAAKDQKSALKALELAGHTRQEAKEILENELRALYEEEELSPEEKARREKDERLAKYEAEEKARKEAIEQEARTKEERDYLNKLDDEIAEAIESTDLPKHPILGKMAINYMSSFASQGQDLSAKEAMQYVAADFKTIVRDVLSQMDAKAVKQYLKDDHVKGLRDEALSEYQAKQKPFAQPAVAAKPAPQAENKPVNEVKRSKDFFSPFK